MAEFLGARISLVSKSDIRYVGTLHEINSEASTVALENVTSFGTEGRKGITSQEIAPSDIVYEYIVFRGTDVKDLRIEETPEKKENKPQQPPHDPAIQQVGGARSAPQASNRPAQSSSAAPQAPPGALQGAQTPGPHGPPQQGGLFGQGQYPPPFYPGPPQGWGRGAPPPGAFPPMPYGAPPGWFPGPGQGFPPGPFPPYGYPPGPPGQFPPQQQNQGPKPAPIGPGGSKQANQSSAPQESDKSAGANDVAKPAASSGPTPPIGTKPSPSEVRAASQSTLSQPAALAAASKAVAPGPKNNGRVQPAIPLTSPAPRKNALEAHAGNNTSALPPKPADSSIGLGDATQAATAAVAAAMAKLSAGGQANGSAVDNLTRKVNEMRASETIRAPRQPGMGGRAGFDGARGGRGGRGGARAPNQKIGVPATDFDFETANAKFNKQDLVKEAIAGSPLTEQPTAKSPTETETPVSGYNKSSSFFDNISSESKDRMEAGNARPGGREWRGEEQKKNVETFGQGSVDNGYRGGFRGRGRGRGAYRGRGHSGNGQPRGRGSYRGRGDEQAIVQ